MEIQFQSIFTQLIESSDTFQQIPESTTQKLDLQQLFFCWPSYFAYQGKEGILLCLDPF
jgi:hypothetical protein